MATRFYLPSSGSTDVSPTMSAEWEHQQGTRRPLNRIKGSTTLTNQAYTPDAADHTADQDAMFFQFISETLAPQTISAQTLKLVVQINEGNAGNNCFVTWKVFTCSRTGTVKDTILAIRRDGTEINTTLQNRVDSATSTQVTTVAGDRIVLEFGIGGLPVAASGTQGHNGTVRMGESGATDAPEDDSSTSTTENPWFEFANTLTFENVVVAWAGGDI